MQERIYLSPPSVSKIDKQYINAAFDSNWIAPIGPEINKFERDLASYLSIEHACAVSSGTAALHLALKVFGIKKGDKVLCPSLTFAASANCIKYVGATPIFVDINLDTWTIDLDLLERAIKKYKPDALITVDLYGQSCSYNEILVLCKENNVKIIEDAAEALGSEYDGKKCGAFGDISIISFNGNKIITTSGGGMLLSKTKSFIDQSKYLASQARGPELHYEHKELGYNYRLSNLLAALGRSQLISLEKFVKERRSIFNYYHNVLSDIDGINFMKEAKLNKSNRWLTTLTIDPSKTGYTRDKVKSTKNNENIESRPVWKPMHLQPFYKGAQYVKNTIDSSALLFETGLCLPSGSALSFQQQDKIIDLILSIKK